MTRLRIIRTAAVGSVLAAVAAIAGCSRDDLLGVTDPDIISPEQLESPDGAEGQRLGALARFKLMTALDESSWFYGGMLVDEWKSADTFTQRDETDQRVVTLENTLVTVAYRRINQTRIAAHQAILALRRWKPTATTGIAEMFFVKGYAELQSASDFCNGQPFADLSGATPQVGMPVSSDSAFRMALASFDSALVVLGTPAASDSVGQRVLNAIHVGRGRAYLGLGRPDLAGAAAAPVTATGFSYNLTWPGQQGKEDNLIWTLNVSARRYTVQDTTDPQGSVRIPNSMPFISAADPRVPVVRTRNAANTRNLNGFDGVTPHHTQLVFPNFNSAVPVANYVDARLMVAEGQLYAGDFAGWLGTLNALRTGPTNIGAVTVSGMTPLVDPVTAQGRQYLMFRERAFWTFGRGQRLGDLRRYMRAPYGFTAAQIFPGEGATYPRKNAPFGQDVNLPVPQAEENNPNFHGCTDRKA